MSRILVQLGNIGALGDRRDLGEKTKRMSVVFFVSSPAEIFQDYHPIVAIVRFTSGRLDGNVRRHTAKENGVRLDRSQDCLQRGRVERTDAVLGDEEIRVGLVQRLVDFRCPSTKLKCAKLLGGSKERRRLGPFAIVG